MFKKVLATGLLAVLAVFAVPAAANAYEVTDGSDVTTTPGTSVTMTFSGFDANEPTTASAPDAVTLGVVKVVSTASRAANASGVVTYSVTASTPGTYTVTVTGVSGKVAVGTLTVVPTDSGAGAGSNGALPNTGLETPMLIIWGAAGALALGIALTVVLTIVRRQKASV